ncbi:head GIN domain-containing protein [Gracilimonas mengyeensis]|uniref:Auto-transporter adhesin, head GIN domain n=1 Tax=Gracilimonas mengyeensis TaxID=1302730 RepID=A0A521F761_9BACT|nr:head GIN domain-containing protein [Gracilimonas mengyeensis]SMO91441.1 Putative auto-transporter adhesin, head GIN domain [Gracilimonas mengyeensis]
MKKLASYTLLGLVIVALVACEETTNSGNGDCIRGSGDIVTRDYSISDFSKVSVFAVTDVTITKDESTALRIKGQRSVMDVLNVEVFGPELSIGHDNCFEDIEPLKIEASTATLSRVQHFGVGRIKGNGIFNGDDFEAVVSGVADMDFDLNVEHTSCVIGGTGNITIRGRAEHQDYVINGAGDINGYNLEGQDARVLINGAGNCRVNVEEELEVLINGTGHVYYRQNPTLSLSVNGVGSAVAVE